MPPLKQNNELSQNDTFVLYEIDLGYITKVVLLMTASFILITLYRQGDQLKNQPSR